MRQNNCETVSLGFLKYMLMYENSEEIVISSEFLVQILSVFQKWVSKQLFSCKKNTTPKETYSNAG